MKNIGQIISTLTSHPKFKKISQKRCFMKVIKLLPPHLSRAVLFTYTKNSTLFVVLNHPGMKMEFGYKNSLILNLLQQVKNIDPNCKDMENIKNIKYFVSNSITKKESKEKVLTFKEKSKGEFSILTEDKNLQDLFLKIKSKIKAYHDRA